MYTKYKALKKAIIRTPLFPLEWLKTTDKILKSPFFQEGLYLASPLVSNLYKKEESSSNIQNTIHKYAHRATSRCTPYGLFAGNSIAQVDTNTSEIKLMDISTYHQHLSLDIAYVRKLIELLKHDTYIRENINYFTTVH